VTLAPANSVLLGSSRHGEFGNDDTIILILLRTKCLTDDGLPQQTKVAMKDRESPTCELGSAAAAEVLAVMCRLGSTPKLQSSAYRVQRLGCNSGDIITMARSITLRLLKGLEPEVRDTL
jgi:hypothetical protein